MNRMLALATLLAVAGCGPGSSGGPGMPGNPATPGGGAPPAGTPGGNAGAGGAPAGTAQIAVEVEHGAADPAIQGIELHVVGLGFFFDHAGAPPRGDDRCELGDVAVDLDAAVRLDLDREGRTPVATAELEDEREVDEVRLLVAGAEVEREDHRHDAHGAATCLAADGTPLIVIRVHPDAPFRLEHGKQVRVVVRFDPRAELGEDHVACVDHGGGGGHDGGGDGSGGDDGQGGGSGGMGDGSGHGLVGAPGASATDQGADDQAPECREADQDDDDGDPGTRLRFFLPADLHGRAEDG